MAHAGYVPTLASYGCISAAVTTLHSRGGGKCLLIQVELPVATGVGALAAIAFLLARLRQREREFSLLDGLILVVLMSIATAGGSP